MTLTARPQARPATSPCRPSDRRERRPMHPVSGHPDIPVFLRADAAPHPVTQARPAVPASQPLAQVIHMAATGVWVVKRNGRMTEINGRSYWSSRRDLTEDAARAGVGLSDLVVNTGAEA
ncbi:hypothetical protein [Azospirillum sp. sgz302134]